ncbi:hypothetical protein TNCV_1684761 [Trichonephila clavipes]|nr:hypothetical protein TNCV_1684761 [Trichonephila clavipes]
MELDTVSLRCTILHENGRCKHSQLMKLWHNKRLQHNMVPTSSNGICGRPTVADFLKQEWPKDECIGESTPESDGKLLGKVETEL